MAHTPNSNALTYSSSSMILVANHGHETLIHQINVPNFQLHVCNAFFSDKVTDPFLDSCSIGCCQQDWLVVQSPQQTRIWCTQFIWSSLFMLDHGSRVKDSKAHCNWYVNGIVSHSGRLHQMNMKKILLQIFSWLIHYMYFKYRTL